ncbi:addiction module protein [Pedobacter sp. V48]|uniref:addiction module protein n=1 Tax=Pedobacter sp. V48 TaxID=509635 RepID=UPI0004ACEE6E|nr:addiction module protein [Pedobacter sp. V48]
MVEEEINEQINLWEDKDFLKEIDMRLDEYESGKVKTSTWEVVKQKAKLAVKG